MLEIMFMLLCKKHTRGTIDLTGIFLVRNSPLATILKSFASNCANHPIARPRDMPPECSQSIPFSFFNTDLAWTRRCSWVGIGCTGRSWVEIRFWVRPDFIYITRIFKKIKTQCFFQKTLCFDFFWKSRVFIRPEAENFLEYLRIPTLLKCSKIFLGGGYS